MEKRPCCPKCGGTSLITRKRLKPTYKCATIKVGVKRSLLGGAKFCHFEFEVPAESKIEVGVDARITDIENKVLCVICEKHYHYPKFKSCFKCNIIKMNNEKTNNIVKIKEQKINLKSTKDLIKFKSDIESGEIGIDLGWTYLIGIKTKIRHGKEWKETRDNLIKSSCEKCGSNKILTLQHTKQPRPQGLSLIEFIDKLILYLSCVHTKTLCRKCAYLEDIDMYFI